MYWFVFYFLVLVDGEVIAVVDDFLFRDHEGLVCSLSVQFFVSVVESFNDVWDIIFFDLCAFVIKAVSICFHVIEPDVVGAAMVCLGEDQDSGGDAGIWFEDTGWHGNNGFQSLVFDEFFADGKMCFGGAKQNAVRYDAGTSAADLQHLNEQVNKEKFCLLCLAYFQQICGDNVIVQTSLEWRVGQNQ